MQLTLGFSPCPNDTFLFDAMIHGKIDTEGLQFDVIMEDVETLNRMAKNAELDITKLSYHAFAYLTESYALLRAGSALGRNCGPLLISKKILSEEKIKSAKIAIPGRFTTANFLLGLAYPDAYDKEEVLFSEIENKVLEDQYDAGLIIHENRFTYQEKGLKKIIDLGEYWESTTGLPIPLGGIVAKRKLGVDIVQKIDRVLRRSVQYAFDHPESSMDFVKAYAQEMDEEVMRQHIALYVNEYSLELGEKGEQAINHLFDEAVVKGLIPGFYKIFI